METKSAKIENCKIAKASIEFYNGCSLTAWITVVGDGWGCGFGGFAFDEPPRKVNGEFKGERRGSAYGTECIARIMRVFEVEHWEDLNGLNCRVETGGIGYGINKIGHIYKDKWFSFVEVAKEYQC